MLMRAGYDDPSEKIPALHVATQDYHSSALEVILKVGGFIVNPKDEKDYSPWMKAASRGHTKIIKVLLDADAQTNATDNRGATALMMVTEGGHEAIVRYLLQKHADTRVKYSAGETAIDIAVAKNDHDMVQLLTKMRTRGISERESMSDNDNDYDDIKDRTEDISNS